MKAITRIASIALLGLAPWLAHAQAAETKVAEPAATPVEACAKTPDITLAQSPSTAAQYVADLLAFMRQVSALPTAKCLTQAAGVAAQLRNTDLGSLLKLTPEQAKEAQVALDDAASAARRVTDSTKKKIGTDQAKKDTAAIPETDLRQLGAAQAAADSLQKAHTAINDIVDGGARYSIYAGSAFTLSPNGSWSSGLDTVFRSETALKSMLRGYFQLSYVRRGSDKVDDGTTTPDTPPDPTAPSFVSPFDGQGGVVNLQAGLSLMPKWQSLDWLGFSARGGYESLPTEDSSGGLNNFRPFVAAGMVTRNIYTAQDSLGQIFFGYARDYRWKKEFTGDTKDRYDRVLVSGLLELFQVQKAAIATRLSANMPISGKGDTEFRISMLIGFKLTDVGATLGVSP